MSNFKLNTIDTIDEEFAKSLVGKHIHFTWHNRKEKAIETMPGLVKSYDKGILKVDIMDIFSLDIDDFKGHPYKIKDITDVYVFNEYNKNYEKLRDIDDEEINKELFEITNIFGNTITSKVLDYDYPLYITILIDDKPYDYPIYFIKEIKIH